MNGTFQLIRRARREGRALRPPQTCAVSGGMTSVRAAPQNPALMPGSEEPIHTGAIYRELMRKYDRVSTRHLK